MYKKTTESISYPCFSRRNKQCIRERECVPSSSNELILLIRVQAYIMLDNIGIIIPEAVFILPFRPRKAVLLCLYRSYFADCQLRGPVVAICSCECMYKINSMYFSFVIWIRREGTFSAITRKRSCNNICCPCRRIFHHLQLPKQASK